MMDRGEIMCRGLPALNFGLRGMEDESIAEKAAVED